MRYDIIKCSRLLDFSVAIEEHLQHSDPIWVHSEDGYYVALMRSR
jgi:hypothetical protein